LSLLRKKQYSNYWFDTATPDFLMEFMKKENIDINPLIDSNISFNGDFPTFNLKDIDFGTILLQTGYLTIKKHEKSLQGFEKYTLDIPNQEVRTSLFKYIVATYTNNTPEEIDNTAENFISYILTSDEENLTKTVDILIGKVAYHYDTHNWKHYQSIFRGFFMGMGIKTLSEIPNSQGRIDYVLEYKNTYIIIELKYSTQKTLDEMLKEAKKQIYGKRYYQTYQDKNIITIAIAIKETEKIKETKAQIRTLKELKEELKEELK
jgi:hypothetical protein